MFFKKFKFKSLLILLTLFIIPINIYAYSSEIIAGGQNIGIEIKTNGIVIVGTYKTGEYNPAKEAGLEIGDIIVSIDEQDITTIEEMVNTINTKSTEYIKIGFLRNGLINYTNLQLYKGTDSYKTGLYVKDTVSGIGTLTFIDPNTKTFGALGHEITERNTGSLLEIKNGRIYTSVVTNIIPSNNGVPGEKNAKMNKNEVIGNIYENTDKGIFGKYEETIPDYKTYKVGNFENIKKGEAKILTVVEDEKVEEFSINILKVNSKQLTKNIIFEITDSRLLDKTGGIVQGMSGSPIIQGDYIIGAVTHVVVDNPNKGYGIFITNMLEEAEN